MKSRAPNGWLFNCLIAVLKPRSASLPWSHISDMLPRRSLNEAPKQLRSSQNQPVRCSRAQRPIAAAILWAAAALGTGAWSTEARGADLCSDVAHAAPAADPADPLVASAHSVWNRVYRTFHATTGRTAEFVVLADSARRLSGQAYPPNAFICAAAAGPPTVFLTYKALALLRQDGMYDANFLAVVLAHELGHRIYDFDAAGKVIGRPGAKTEARADGHGAFLAASAGYNARALACDAVLDRFLELEAHVDLQSRQIRRSVLPGILNRFDAYESLYEALGAITFWFTEHALAALTWVDETLASRGEGHR